jgi:predicted transcriptional regulator of viral defense system
MDKNTNRRWFWLMDEQHGVVELSQVRQANISRGSLEHRLKSGKWRRMHRGVYAAFTGEVSREARLWAAVHRAGPGAMLSHESAAEAHGLSDEPSSEIHITVPSRRRPAQKSQSPAW